MPRFSAPANTVPNFRHAQIVEALIMRQLGQQLKITPKTTGGEYGGKSRIDGSRKEPSNPTKTLEDHGISDKKLSMLAQQVAD